MTMPPSPPPPPRWMSEVPNRAGNRYKMHANLGHAKNAVGQSYGKIWEWVNEAWVLLYDVPPSTKRGYRSKDELPWNVEKAAAREAKKTALDRMHPKTKSYLDVVNLLS